MAITRAEPLLSTAIDTFRATHPNHVFTTKEGLLAALQETVRPCINTLGSCWPNADPDALAQRIRLLLAISVDSIALAFDLPPVFITNYSDLRALKSFTETHLVAALNQTPTGPYSVAAKDFLTSYTGTP